MQLIHRLVVLNSPERHVFFLEGAIYSIGRDPYCDIPLSDRRVSRYHATLLQVAPEENKVQYQIIDGNYQFVDGVLTGKPSTNGIFVNNRKVRRHDLQNGDEIIIGYVRLAYYTDLHTLPGDQPPSDPNSYTPRKPYPSAPDFGAETLPDGGFSQIQDRS